MQNAYAAKIIKEKEGEEKTYFIEFGFLPVRLPECPQRPLWLVVVKGFGKKPLMILTTEPMRRNRKVLWWAVEAYLTRWRAELNHYDYIYKIDFCLMISLVTFFCGSCSCIASRQPHTHKTHKY